MLEGADSPVSEHDTEDEARERMLAYVRGAAAAAAPTAETGVPRGARVKLRDGAEVILRPVDAADAPLLLDGFAERFDERSRYQRFMGPKKRLTPTELAYFTDVDHSCHEAVGALDPATGDGIGIARFVREGADGSSAEVAVAIADGWQGCGLGGALLDALVARAREVGVTEFTASVLATNRAMLTLFGRLGEMEVVHDSGTTVRVVVRLP